jgi:adenylate cyclase class 2
VPNIGASTAADPLEVPARIRERKAIATAKRSSAQVLPVAGKEADGMPAKISVYPDWLVIESCRQSETEFLKRAAKRFFLKIDNTKKLFYYFYLCMRKDIIEIYKDLYGLPEISRREAVDLDFFRLCRENYKFIVISIYNEKKEFLLLRDLNKDIGWELIGGYLEKDETLEDGVNRIVMRETGLDVDELQPIVLVNNNFECDSRVISHFGIAFTARARGTAKFQPENIRMVYSKNIPEKMAYQNKRILQESIEQISFKSFKSPIEEIESSKNFFLPHFVNKYFVKNIIGRFSSDCIKDEVTKLISGNPKSIIDLSCGDDDFIFELERRYRPEICLANDISWKLISLIKKKDRDGRIIFTNHDIADLPFRRKFDLAIFKNTFHHIPFNLQAGLVKKLSSLSRQFIIIDIEDPTRSSFFAKIWNWYYIHFLGDQGESFLTFEKFKETIKNNIANKEIVFGIVNTIKGKYFYASSSENKKKEEVEIKVRMDQSSASGVRKKLLKLGALLKEKAEERDIYFTSPHRDFIKTKECLRIRQKGGCLELTYKGPTTKLMEDKKQFWKNEVNIPLLSTKEDAENFLESLDFEKVVEVVKDREKFVLGRQEIAIDNIENGGWFLEVEIMAEGKEERESALEENMSLLKKIGLSEKDIAVEPYRDIVLKSLKN